MMSRGGIAIGRQGQKAFSLIELSVVIVIISLVAVMGLEATSIYIGRTAYTTTRDKIAVIDQALRDYYKATGRLPCPAARATAENYTSTTYYGYENCSSPVSAPGTVIASGSLKWVYTGGTITGSYSAGAATINNTGTGGTGATATCATNGVVTVTAGGSGYSIPPAVSCTGGTGAGGVWTAGISAVYEGAVPIVELGLPVSAGVDGWGDKINYAVTQGLTDARTFPQTPSNIEIRSGKLKQPCSGTCQVLASGTAVGGTTVTNGGSGYGAAPTVTFSASPTGDTATGTSILSGSSVSSITLVNPGSGYVTPPTITFGSGAATATAYLSPGGAAYAIFSSGADKRGAVTRNGVNAGNCLPTPTTTYDLRIDSQNCAAIAGATLDTTNIGGTIPGNVVYDSRYNSGTINEDSYFDDIVTWRSKGQL